MYLEPGPDVRSAPAGSPPARRQIEAKRNLHHRPRSDAMSGAIGLDVTADDARSHEIQGRDGKHLVEMPLHQSDVFRPEPLRETATG